MLALSSASLRLLRKARFAPRKLFCFEMVDAGESPFASVAKACVLATDNWVVALETSCGLVGAVEWDVPGRERKPSCGRGGSGGGVSPTDAIEVSDALREYLRIIFRVGFAKSCDSMRSPVFDLQDALLLSCVGVVGELCPLEAGVWGSAFPVSSIKIAVDGHLDSGVVCIIAWRDNRSLKRGAS
jgi:hypothetical protein